MKSNKMRLLFLGLNEFNIGLITEAAEVFDLKNFKRLLALHKSQTVTDDTYDSNFLEPWVQWVSVQTGTPSTEHHIKHLGDIPNITVPQIWETLSQIGVTSGVWGAMNASKGLADNCLFFIPDPWMFSEDAHPEELSRLLELPRYIAKNYLNLSKKVVFNKFLKLLGVFSKTKTGLKLAKEFPRFLKDVFKFRGDHFVFIAFTDYLLTNLFVEYRKKFSPQFTFIFLNSIAHMQHHHWKGELATNDRLRIGLGYIDRALKALLDDLNGEERLLVTNALSQKNTNAEPAWILYRQKDQELFLERMGINPLRVEAHMTHDAHIFFETLEECMIAEEILKTACIRDQKLFLVESYKAEPQKLFYRIDFTGEVFPHEVFKLGGKEWRFSDYFEAIVTRTGKHIPNGTVLTNAPDFPPRIYNHQIADYILGYFLPDVDLQDQRPAENVSRDIHPS